MKQIIFQMVMLSVLTGCTTLKPETVVNPSEITVKDALKSVAEGIAELKSELDKNNIQTGALIDEVELTLVLTSKATDQKQLAVDISKTLTPNTGGIGGKLFGINSVEYAEGNRNSTLKIKLKNKATADIKHPEYIDGQVSLEPGVSEGEVE